MDSLQVFTISEERRYWVVRSGEEGKYLGLFRSFNKALIGHADVIDFSADTDFSSEMAVDRIVQRFRNIHKDDESQSRVSNLAGQIRRFLWEISVNDIIISVSRKAIMAGRVLSAPYIQEDELEHTTVRGEVAVCEYKLARDVVWSSRIKRETIPFELENSLHNASAVFEISSEQKVGILKHWLSPVHFSGDILHISSRIENDNSIGNHPMTRYSMLLDQLELLSKNVADAIRNGEQVSVEQLDRYLARRRDYDYVLTTQQAFMSPGDHFIQLSADPLQRRVFAILFAGLFNTSLVFAQDSMGELTPDLVGQVVEVSAAMVERTEFEEVKEDLKLRLPSQDERVLDTRSELEDVFPDIASSRNTPI